MPAPLIAAALAAIAPALARQGLDLLSGVFRGALDKGTQEIADLIEEKTGIDISDAADNKLGAEQWGKLKEFELQYQDRLLAYRQQADASDLERQRLANDDRADARDLQKTALSSDSWLAKNFIYLYALLLTVFAFGFISYAAFGDVDYTKNEHARRVVDTVIGFLLGVTLSAIIQYFFGSSSSSKAKDDKLGVLAEALRAQRGKPGSEKTPTGGQP